MLRIRFDRGRLLAGKPGVAVEPVNDGIGSINYHEGIWSGFEATRGTLFIRSEGGHAWMEYHGDDDRIAEGGTVLGTGGGREQFGFHTWPVEGLDRIQATRQAVGAVNVPSMMSGDPAVTLYSPHPRGLVGFMWWSVRLDGPVRSVIVDRPDEAALSWWVEGARGEIAG